MAGGGLRGSPRPGGVRRARALPDGRPRDAGDPPPPGPGGRRRGGPGAWGPGAPEPATTLERGDPGPPVSLDRPPGDRRSLWGWADRLRLGAAGERLRVSAGVRLGRQVQFGV